MSTNLEKKCCYKCALNTSMRGELGCDNYNCPCHSSTPMEGEWEKEFDEMFVKISGQAGFPKEWVFLEGPLVAETKAFIRVKIASAREEGRERERVEILVSLPDADSFDKPHEAQKVIGEIDQIIRSRSK